MLRRNINTIASSLSVVAPTVRADKKSCESGAAMVLPFVLFVFIKNLHSHSDSKNL